MNDLVKRSVTGVLFVLVILAAIVIHPFVFAILFLAILVLTQLEFFGLLKNAGYSLSKISPVVLGGLLFVSCFAAANQLLPWQICLIFFPILFISLGIEVFRKSENTFQNALVSLFGIVYISLPFSLLNFIVVPGFPTQPVFVPYILLGIFFIIWVYDSMAYVFGSLLGKHKIAPEISPHKSWEGLIGGAVFAIIMAILNAVIFQSESMISWIVMAVIIVVFGTVGDFFESKFKREIGAKDSGSILPGHGGLLDRFDSFLFAIPVVYLWLIFGGRF